MHFCKILYAKNLAFSTSQSLIPSIKIFKTENFHKQASIYTFDNQQINKYSWITFNLLKTYLLFILLIEKTYIALPKLLL